MKKVAIVTKQMIVGGIERVLISMLKAIPKGKLDITVYVMEDGGEFQNNIPDWVKLRVIPRYGHNVKQSIINCLKKGNLLTMVKVFYFAIVNKSTNDFYRQCLNISKTLPKLKEEYDLAIAYYAPVSFPVVYVANNIKARNKIAWIHSDVEKMGIDLSVCKNEYLQYDKIFSVCNYCKAMFDEVFPELSYKSDVFYNIVSYSEIVLKGCEDANEFKNDKTIKILTVGRLHYHKGQDMIPDILMKLKSDGYNVTWYLIGDGELRAQIQDKIDKYSLDKNLILLGTKANPYPYIKQCDIYVQSSRNEGYCTTTTEAKIFSKPIVATDVSGAREQFVHEKTGLIVAINIDDIYNSIKRLIDEPNLRMILSQNLKKVNFNSSNDLEKLYKFL